MNNKKKQSKYNSLTPTNQVKNCEVYMDALQEALQNPDIKNVAVTGPYGAGKSSVIRTFFDKHNGEYKHITITLANFLDNNIQKPITTQEDTTTQKNTTTPQQSGQTAKISKATPQETSTITGNDLEQLIERSIVQQLFYSVNDSSIPASHFKKIKKQDKFELFCIVLFILLCLLSVSYLLHPDILWSILKVKNVPVFTDNILRVLALFFAVWGIYEAIKKVVQIAISISVKQLHIKEAGIELDKQEHKSILNYHIDEIIYFFEATEKNVVVIEDIDRFNHQGIFTKLREINYLINNCEKIHQKVVFIYALKDEMFQDKDRTKFFDFIIPIIPIVNYSNSSEILRKEFLPSSNGDAQRPNQSAHIIPEELIENLSYFIDDMRLLNNIINEYKMYSQFILQHNPDAKGILAMVAYKNLYPEDFSLLSQNNGLLFKIIDKKNEHIQNEIKKKEKEIEQIQLKIEELEEKIIPLNLKELRIVYLTAIVKHLTPVFVAFEINGKRYNITQCADNEDYFNSVISNTARYIHLTEGSYAYPSTRNLGINWDAIQKEINPKLNYKQRVELLNKTQTKALNERLQQLISEKDRIANYSLQEMLNQSIIQIDTSIYSEYSPSHLACVSVLLREGYINENYWDYISIFHEGTLTVSDEQFLMKVKCQTHNDFHHKLSQVKNLILKINPYDFSKPYILNDDLVDYLLSEDYLLIDSTEERKQNLFAQLSMMRARALQFVIHYLDRNKNIDKFLYSLCYQRRNIWKMLATHIHDTDQLQFYFQQIIKHVAIDDIVNQFYMDETNYIENYADYWLIETDKERLKEVIQQLNIKFALLSKETSPEDLDYIYRSNAYQINIDVMRIILSKREQWDDLAFNTRNYSYIMETYPEMAKYIQDNLSEYVDNVFLKLTNNNDIKTEHLIELLNTETLPVDQKKQIINHVTATNPIECITDISDKSLWTEICNNNLMAANWENIKALVYSEEINFAEVYTKFLNNEENARKLSYQKLEEDIDLDEGKAEIAYTLIYNPNLKDNSYQFLLNSFTGIYSLQPTDLSENRMRWLLEKDLIEINIDSYKYLKENYSPLHIDFLEKHLAEFSKSNYQNMDFDAEDITKILDLPINILEKQKIINTITDANTLNTDIVIEKLSSFIMNNTVGNHIPKNSLINYIAQQTIVPVDVRKNMYIRYAPHITDITTFLTNLGEPYSLLLDKDKDTDISRKDTAFLRVLQENKYLGRFTKRPKREMWIIKKEAKLF